LSVILKNIKVIKVKKGLTTDTKINDSGLDASTTKGIIVFLFLFFGGTGV
jgi:hypothetical protein